MPNPSRDVMLSTIAVLFTPPDHPVTVSRQQAEEVMRPPLTIAKSLIGPDLIVSQREQVEIQLAVNKVDVRDVSGNQDFSDSRVPELLTWILGIIEPSEFISFGVNFIVQIDPVAVDEWSIPHLAHPNLTSFGESLGISVSRVDSTLRCEVPPKQWNIKFEMKPENDAVMVDLNAHEKISNMPSTTDLLSEMTDQFAKLSQFLDKLKL